MIAGTSVSRRVTGIMLLFALVAFTTPAAGPVPAALLAGLSWRNLGPFRAGRVSAVAGAVGAGQAGVFYAGFPLGGVWKTTSAGETWYPVFDSVKEVSSVGAIAVAPSNPDVVYVGMGDLITGGGINEGNGVYKSTDAGRTWQHLGLEATKQIPSILVDPKNPDLVLLAAQGDVHKKSDTRGVYRSTDGGRTWTKTLYVDDSTGAQKITWADDHPDVLLATTVRHWVPAPSGPARFIAGGFGGPGGGGGATQTHLFKSTDEGVTWKEITGGGLPRLNGRTSIAIAQNTNAQRMFLIQNSGLYRSDDGGATWRQMDSTDTRIRNGQGGYNCGVYVDPKNPDIVYTVNTASYKSTDGGNTFTGFKGAPGGDDPQQMWIDPTNGQRMEFGYDQGAIVSLDGGANWSSWYNQSTEQVYHIAVDNSYPAWVYASQQDAGAIRTRLRGNLGAITPLDWSPEPGWEWGTEAPDPTNTNIVYASGVGIFKISYPSEQWIDVSPQLDPALHARSSVSQPIAFAPWNPRELVAGFQFVMTSVDGGVHWTKISPDLGFPKDTVPTPDSLRGKPGLLAGGTIQSLAMSPLKREIWVGTNNGLIKLTQDEGKTWTDVSIGNMPGVAGRADMLALEASHFDPAEAYVVFSLHTSGDYTPYIYRTRDYGKSWTLITAGLATGQPSGSFARVLREDPKTRGLLFAGTESGMYVSFDDGDRWQPLQLNLPNTSCRDLVIHGNDLVLGTYGRGIWVIDDISPLRQMAQYLGTEPARLFVPGDAIRVRRNVGNDTPFPPEVPHALNPPDGAIIYYTLAAKPAGAVTLEVLDPSGAVLRHMTSGPVEPVKEAAQPPEPNFWIAPPFQLPANAGGNRTNWDLRTDAPPSFTHTFEINANPGLTPPSPLGPLVPPGAYTLRLTVDGKAYTQPVTVVNDPRSPATVADVRAQYALEMRVVAAMQASWDGYQEVEAARAGASKELDSTLVAVGGDPSGRFGRFGGGGGFRPGGPPPPTFVGVNETLRGMLNGFETGDLAPTPAMLAEYADACKDLAKAATTFNALVAQNHLKQAALAAPQCPASQ